MAIGFKMTVSAKIIYAKFVLTSKPCGEGVVDQNNGVCHMRV